jgi:hypothetical protein
MGEKGARDTNRTPDERTKMDVERHTIRKDQNTVERIVLDWKPKGTRKRGRPKKIFKK